MIPFAVNKDNIPRVARPAISTSPVVFHAPDYVPPPVPERIKPAPNVIPFPGGIGKGGPWTINPYWLGETIFVVASGPSIRTTNFDLIRGRKIICVNSSIEMVPFADMVYFGDGRWWDEHKRMLINFPGHIVTCSGLIKHPRVLRITRLKPVNAATGFHDGRDGVASQRTSLQGAMNIAAHLGSNEKVQGRIVLLGADMGRDAKDGVSHGHPPHKWPSRPGNITWDEQLRHLKWIVSPLKNRKIEVINCSMVSRIPWWPKMPLEEFLAKEKRK